MQDLNVFAVMKRRLVPRLNDLIQPLSPVDAHNWNHNCVELILAEDMPHQIQFQAKIARAPLT